MDYFQRLIAALFFFAACSPALAAFPAEPGRNTWCWSRSSPPNAASCFLSPHASVEEAARSKCQWRYDNNWQAHNIIVNPGLNAQGQYSARTDCRHSGGTIYDDGSYDIVNFADCKGTGAPINNYAPPTCSGEPPSTSSSTAEQCLMTNGVIIPGYVKTSTPVSLACYGGCQYTPTVTSMDTYNGITYQDGGWKGNGKVCSGSEATAGGGSPTGANGITAGDLARLNQEITQKQVLSVLQQILAKTGGPAPAPSSNPQIDVTNAKLEQIRAADEAARNDRSDPDGLEATEQAALAANPTNALTGVPSSTVNVGNTFSAQNGFLPGQCPAPPSFTVRGQEYSYDITPICSMAQMLSFLVIAFATVVGVRIFIGGNS